jgi:uncharacterized repeat protein (TIGR03943 family)
MRRETQNILLILVGGALLKISINGTYLRYVKPSQQIWLLVAGAVMVALALVSIGRDLVSVRRGELDEHDHDDAHDHGEHHHSARSAWLMLLPVLAIFLVAPPALGADSVLRADPNAAQSSASDTSLFPPLPQGDNLPVQLNDFSARASFDSGHSLDNRVVALTGFVVHQGKDVYVARLAIACCAADAFPVKIKLVNAADVSGLKDDTWVNVLATLVPGSATRENEYVPAVVVTHVQKITQPEDPYEH